MRGNRTRNDNEKGKMSGSYYCYLRRFHLHQQLKGGLLEQKLNFPSSGLLNCQDLVTFSPSPDFNTFILYSNTGWGGGREGENLGVTVRKKSPGFAIQQLPWQRELLVGIIHSFDKTTISGHGLKNR